jgi:hypothetical protein
LTDQRRSGHVERRMRAGLDLARSWLDRVGAITDGEGQV